MTFHDFPQLLLHVLNSECSVELFAMQVWMVWFRRNKVRIAPLGFPLNLISQRAYEALMEYRIAQQWTIRTRTSVEIGARWSPLPNGQSKLWCNNVQRGWKGTYRCNFAWHQRVGNGVCIIEHLTHDFNGGNGSHGRHPSHWTLLRAGFR